VGSTTLKAGSAPARGRLPVAPRDKRPALAALAALLILVGALGSALVAFRSGERVDVLVARHDLEMGQRITREDLGSARVAADGGATIDAAALENFVGSYAAGPVPAGTLLNRLMFVDVSDVVPSGAQRVGLVVDVGRRTTVQPATGDVVQLIYVSGSGGQPVGNLSPGDVVVEAARVTDVGSGGGSGSTSLSVLLQDSDAGTVADLASANSLAVTVLPSDTEPVVDLVTE
jgi:hypothetical protein